MEEIKTNLNAIEVIGKILIFTPLIVALPLILYAIMRTNVGIGDDGAGFSAGLMIFAGILALLYVSVKQYKEKKEV